MILAEKEMVKSDQMRNRKVITFLSMHLLAVWFVLISIQPGIAQSVETYKPAPTNVIGADYPRIYHNGEVEFSLKSPDAKMVELRGGAGLCKEPVDMTRDEEGYWHVKLSNVEPGFHYYWFLVDGTWVNDPGSNTFFGYNRAMSGIEIPSSDEDFYTIKPVPHGEIREHWYYSNIAGCWRRVLVYTPPGYEKEKNGHFPVLYLLHGTSENETAWHRQGKANFILDNLIAEGNALPMILVMINAEPFLSDSEGSTLNTWMQQDEIKRKMGNLESIFVKELIPEIDSTYRTLADRNNRAIAGASRGALQTLLVGFHNLGKFNSVGFFSPPFRESTIDKLVHQGIFADLLNGKNKPDLVWFGVGDAGEKEQDFYRYSVKWCNFLKQRGVNSIFFESESTGHDWQTWRRCMKSFTSMLFRPGY